MNISFLTLCKVNVLKSTIYLLQNYIIIITNYYHTNKSFYSIQLLIISKTNTKIFLSIFNTQKADSERIRSM